MPDYMATVRLGNIDAKDTRTITDEEGNQTVEFTHLAGNRVCHVGIREQSIAEAFASVTAPNGLWTYQSWEPPAWVESDDEGLAAMLAGFYGCPIGRTEGEWIE